MALHKVFKTLMWRFFCQNKYDSSTAVMKMTSELNLSIFIVTLKLNYQNYHIKQHAAFKVNRCR